MNDNNSLVIVVLGILALSSVIGSLVLTALGAEVPEAVIAIGSAAAGAVGGILVPSRS